jgi:hypothetical protein
MEKKYLYNVNVEGEKNGKREKFIMQFVDTALKDNIKKIKHGYTNVKIKYVKRKRIDNEVLSEYVQ